MSFDEKYFNTHAYKDVSFTKYSQYWWSNRFYGMLAKRFGKRRAKFLEIGSGLGHLVARLEKDFSTIAIDVNYWALAESKKITLDTSHVLSSAEEIPFANDLFSVIICKHVVEHIHNPEKALNEMGRITEEKGLLIIATPNLDSPARKWKKKNWIGYQDPTHISLKTPNEWTGLINEAGFEIFRIFSDGFWDAPYVPVIPKIIQKYLFGLLGGIQAVLGIPFLPTRMGESIIIIAKKLS
jgi:SAM-dependent methyltransferase